ncbi:AraC family transcriptional regulator [Longimicrobium terrae]|uniref:AraC-like DNA-binding protein n=1 Tax=Longimicrobium terrae TaxID=1639882 RepID=A0A841H4R5_9BACT|nr:helix-turn-helix domain-containing protein [Longimicrobium terrae]MBB4638692.1 AraC-like DNA-binding protein [Longimicrobium terrae]MBB6072932.1 AraC-like DNA-binding protein [Longimicrobium terrae]NNC31544.1 helix-turn-helix transcriptional regulator [Longimicrobium terrae]
MTDPPLIEFKARSITLLLGAFQGLVLAMLLACTRRNAAANRLLAGLILLMVLRITPYIIGFAGFYDAYPWLTFAPLEVSLGFGPLLYLYIRTLVDGAPPRRWATHLAPAAVQFGYYAGAFSLSLEDKWAWNGAVHEPWLSPAETAAALLSFGVYLALSWRAFGAYQRWLDANLSNREQLRLGWLRGFLIACGGLLVLWAGFAATEAFVRPLRYLDRFPFYVALAALVYYLGLEGWRHAALVYPHSAAMDPVDGAELDPQTEAATDAQPLFAAAVSADPPEAAEAATAAPSAEADEEDGIRAEAAYPALAEGWRTQVSEAGWWRDEGLTLASLARRLHVSPRTLSRGLNEGLGQSFNEFINRMRVDAVVRQLRDPAFGHDVLRAALDAGFNSKASFNRAFKAYTGQTPSALRRAAAAERLIPRQSASPAEIATRDAAR